MAHKKPAEELKTPVSFRLDSNLVNKVSYIVWFDRKQSKTVLFEAALNAITDKWEKKHGPITAEMIAEMEKAIG